MTLWQPILNCLHIKIWGVWVCPQKASIWSINGNYNFTWLFHLPPVHLVRKKKSRGNGGIQKGSISIVRKFVSTQKWNRITIGEIKTIGRINEFLVTLLWIGDGVSFLNCSVRKMRFKIVGDNSDKNTFHSFHKLECGFNDSVSRKLRLDRSIDGLYWK